MNLNIINFIKNKGISTSKVVVVLLVSVYMIYYITSLSNWHFIDNVNLIFHESGHVIFSFFGDFIHTLGGTLMQILVPVTFSFYFYKNEDYFSASLLLFWLSQNLFNIYLYANDAIDMNLPLLGGDSVFHDWNHMLSLSNLLKNTNEIAGGIYGFALIVFIFAIVYSLKFSTDKY